MVKFNLVIVHLDWQIHWALDSMKRQAPGFMCEEEALPQERVASLAVTKYKEFKGKISSCLPVAMQPFHSHSYRYSYHPSLMTESSFVLSDMDLGSATSPESSGFSAPELDYWAS